MLLGLRTAPKEDIHTSAAEMVYGTPLTVPGDFVCPSDDPVAAAELLSNLRDEVLKLRPTPVLRHGTAVSRVPNNIMSTDYVFDRHDAHRGPLHRIYDGPYHVIEHADKTFVLDIGGRLETVSIDRLKMCARGSSSSDRSGKTAETRPSSESWTILINVPLWITSDSLRGGCVAVATCTCDTFPIAFNRRGCVVVATCDTFPIVFNRHLAARHT